MENKKIFCLVVCAVAVLIVGSLSYLGIRQETGVCIFCDVVGTQGAVENNSGIESVKIHGTISNIGDKIAKNVSVTMIFTDPTHDKVVRKKVVEGVDLLPKGVVSVEFDAEYLRELTIPKTLVDETIQVNWIEDGQLRTMTVPSEELSKENGG